jgi:hypothetical protein
MELNRQAQNMEVHKSYWIRVMKDTGDDREVKRQFIKDLGVANAGDAIAYLESCKQTTFVGSWFLTDAELEEEKDREASGKVSVFMDANFSGPILLLEDRVNGQLEELEKNCGGLMKLLTELSKNSPEDHMRIVASLGTLVAWSAELSKTRKGLSDRGQTAYILLDLIETNAEHKLNLLVLFQLTQIFVDYMEGSVWATGKGFNNPNSMGSA